MLVGVVACTLMAAVLASNALAMPPGLRSPSLAEASQIIKFTGYTLSCVAIAVDEHSPKWALIEFHRSAGCPANVGFAGLIVAYENAQQNTNTAGFAWTAALKTADPRCPLSHVPASVARAFEICTGSVGPGRIPAL